MPVKKIENLNKHENPSTNTNPFDIENYLNANWDTVKEVINNNADEIEQAQTNISNLQEDNEANKTKIEEIETKNTEQDTDIEELQDKVLELESENEVLKNQIPTGQAEGENITLNDSAEMEFKELKVSGNSWQETRSGKNKFDISKATKASGSCSFKNNGDSIDITATYIGEYMSANIDITDLFKEGETIYAKANFVASSSNTGAYRIQWGEDTGLTKGDIVLMSSTSDSVKSGVVPTKPEGATKLLLYLYGNITGTVTIGDTVTYSKIMLSNQPITDYEEYGAMPSPEFPSPIRNVGDNVNLFYLQNVSNNSWFSVDEKQLIKIKQGTGVAPTPIPININLSVGDILTISVYCLRGKFNSGNISVGLYHNGNPTSWQGEIAFPRGEFLKNKIFASTATITDEVDSFMPFIYGKPTIEEDIDFYIKVTKGSKSTSYSPYGCGSANIIVYNENVWDEKWELGSLNNTTGEKVSVNTCIRSAEYIPLKPNTTYYFKTAYSEMCFYDKDKKFISSTAKTNETFTTDEKTRYLLFRNATVYGTTYNNDIMLAESNTEVPYTPHEEQSITFPLAEGQRLMEGSYLADDGIHHKRGQIVLDGTENWADYATQVDGCYKGYATSKKTNSNFNSDNSLCNYFKTYKVASSTIKALDTCLCSDQNATYISVSNDVASTVDELKAWLASNPVTLEYDLAEELIEPYTEEQQIVYNQIKKAYSYKNVTHIFSTNELSLEFEATYRKDLETLENNKEERLLALENAVLGGN